MAASKGSWDATGKIPGARKNEVGPERNRVMNRYSTGNNAPMAYSWEAPQRAARAK